MTPHNKGFPLFRTKFHRDISSGHRVNCGHAHSFCDGPAEMTVHRILMGHHLAQFSQAVKSAAHFRWRCGQPNPHRSGAIQFAQRRQADHAAPSTLDDKLSSVRITSASTSRLNPWRTAGGAHLADKFRSFQALTGLMALTR